ncbi:Cof-type HAD-IIB family hydrolase [Exiguobacterium alkaliphilum]|uniref:Cof-type HAD-IIB family hydrolase n=1 Tax=Exiguobacterium alkaliphilum TaxID=1428684 RepID=A0ABT2KZN9_9BACL|nr:Cof-type HAD-IIB family hydrolase [Exiguobacterium alkaliphilum]MCT4796384.1 Cof-type HAD-IIB family hydrolase [Exiguobacterium alkaliphilum]
MIQAVLLDLDGTLLNDQKMISPKTKETLLSLQANGIRIVLASGRPKRGIEPFATELKLEQYGGLIVSSNGACVTDATTGETLFEQAIDRDVARAILDHLTGFDVIPMLNDETYMYVNDVFSGMLELNGEPFNIIKYESRGGRFQLREEPRLADAIAFPVYKILVAGQPDYLQANVDAMSQPFNQQVTGMFTANMYYEFTDYGIDKARALDHVFQQVGIARDQTIAFGDGHNDRSMLEYAGISVAMDNAVDAIKAIATEVTRSNNEEGIAHHLARYLP